MIKKLLVIGILAVLLVGCFSTLITVKADVAPTLNNGLIAYWNFDEGSGTTIIDQSGNNYHGTNTGSVAWINSKYDLGLNFDGTNKHIAYGNILNFGANDNFTISFWLNSTVNTGRQLFCTKNAVDSGSYPQWGIGLVSSRINFIVNANATTGGDFGASGATINTNTYYMITISLNRATGTLSIYLNDQLTGSTYDLLGYGDFTSSGDFNIGSWADYANPNGIIEDFRIYNRILSQSEITYLYDNPQPTPSPSATPTPTATTDPLLIGLIIFALFTGLCFYLMLKPHGTINFVTGILMLSVTGFLAVGQYFGSLWIIAFAGVIFGLITMLRGTDLM